MLAFDLDTDDFIQRIEIPNDIIAQNSSGESLAVRQYCRRNEWSYIIVKRQP